MEKILESYQTTTNQDYTKSACELLIYRTYQETWKRGEKYVNENKVTVLAINDKFIKAIVQGTEKYETNLTFKSGGLSRQCSCPVDDFCKHMVAVAIIWDERRGLTKPNQKEIQEETIPPPAVSYSEIKSSFSNPLKADLDIIRIAAEETGWGGRPHARLLNMPKFITDAKEPLTLIETQKAFEQIEEWENRRNYDLYFCAGEMVAAFCEIMRLIVKRLNSTPFTVAAEILREAQKFHYKLIMELIDDSDGLHEFTEAHLNDLYSKIKAKLFNSKNKDDLIIKHWLREFDSHRDDY